MRSISASGWPGLSVGSSLRQGDPIGNQILKHSYSVRLYARADVVGLSWEGDVKSKD